MSSLEQLFYPNSVAVVGASFDTTKIGHIISKNITETYSKKVYLINPKGGKILGCKLFKTLAELPEVPDLAILCIPASAVLGSIIELGEKGVKYAVVIAAGFKETGEVGKNLELEILKTAQKYNIKIVGPNCLGVLNLDDKANLNASFDFLPKKFGNISLVSQSGALISILIDEICKNGFGLQKIVSMGNKSDLNENDFIKYLIEDTKTDVIGVYLESFTFGERLCEIIKMSPKPIVIFKVGGSKRAQQAAISHTGSLAGDDMIAKSHLQASGAYLVESIEEFSSLLCFLSCYHNRISKYNFKQFSELVVITNAGGVGVATLDAMAQNQLEPLTLTPESQQELSSIIPASGSTHNPIDILGDAPAERYENVLSYCLKNESSPIVVVVTPQVNTQIVGTVQSIIQHTQSFPDSIVLPILMGGNHVLDGVNLLQSHYIMCFSYPDVALKVIKNISLTLEAKKLFNKTQVLENDTVLSKFTNDFSELQNLAQTHYISIPTYQVISHNDDIEILLEKISLPAMIKVVNSSIMHRSDQKMVQKVSTVQEINQFCENFKNEKVALCELAAGGVEVFLGIKQDNQFGLSLLIGSGGVYSEVWKDIACIPLPATPTQILSGFQKTRIFKVIDGFRNLQWDTNSVVETAMNLQKLAMVIPRLQSIEINPLIVHPNGSTAVDIKVSLNSN